MWQGQHWLREIDPTLATRMIHIGHQDYYVYKPAKLQDGNVVMPIHWFSRSYSLGVKAEQKFRAEAWCLEPVSTDKGHCDYIVTKYDTIKVSVFTLVINASDD
jgi:hypothetical protein